jgi:hypothetical protein
MSLGSRELAPAFGAGCGREVGHCLACRQQGFSFLLDTDQTDAAVMCGRTSQPSPHQPSTAHSSQLQLALQVAMFAPLHPAETRSHGHGNLVALSGPVSGGLVTPGNLESRLLAETAGLVLRPRGHHVTKGRRPYIVTRANEALKMRDRVNPSPSSVVLETCWCRLRRSLAPCASKWRRDASPDWMDAFGECSNLAVRADSVRPAVSHPLFAICLWAWMLVFAAAVVDRRGNDPIKLSWQVAFLIPGEFGKRDLPSLGSTIRTTQRTLLSAPLWVA